MQYTVGDKVLYRSSCSGVIKGRVSGFMSDNGRLFAKVTVTGKRYGGTPMAHPYGPGKVLKVPILSKALTRR